MSQALHRVTEIAHFGLKVFSERSTRYPLISVWTFCLSVSQRVLIIFIDYAYIHLWTNCGSYLIEQESCIDGSEEEKEEQEEVSAR
jgi:hypothetical protein